MVKMIDGKDNHQQESNGSFNIMFSFMVLLAFVFGYSNSNILNFAPADTFNLTFRNTLIGIEYSRSISYGIVSLMALCVLSFIKQKILLGNKERINLETIMSGISEIHKTYRFFICTFMLAIGCAYAYCETYISINLNKAPYMMIIITTSAILFTQGYVQINKELPKNIGMLVQSGIIQRISEKKYDGIRYEKIDDQIFEVCMNMKTQSKQFRRVSNVASYEFTKGENCVRYGATKEKNGSQEIINVQIINNKYKDY